MNIFKLLKKIKGDCENIKKIEKIVVGLGNPSPKYENTRHNVGFEALDYIAKKNDFEINKKKFNSLVCDKTIENTRCLFMKPLTFMNASGEAVEEARSFYKLQVSDIIVLFDDIYFEPGTIRIKKNGSSGGHNGIKSIIYCTGEDSFARIKIGVGKKPHKDYDLSKWVLSKFNILEKKKIEVAFKNANSALNLILDGKIEKAMNEFN